MKSFFHVSRNMNPPGCRGADVLHKHGYHEMLYCISGEGGQLTDRGKEELRAGDLFFYPKGSRHCSVFLPGKKFECFVLDFQSSLFSPSSDGDKDIIAVIDALSQRNMNKIKLTESGRKSVERILEELHEEFAAKKKLYDAVIKLKVYELFLTVGRDPAQKNLNTGNDSYVSQKQMIAEVVSYLEEFYIQDVNISTVLRFCPLSRSHFHVVFKRETGRTFNDFLRDVRLGKAKEFLKESDLPIQEISYNCGFSSHAYFTQVFKQITGQTPNEFRQNLN